MRFGAAASEGTAAPCHWRWLAQQLVGGLLLRVVEHLRVAKHIKTSGILRCERSQSVARLSGCLSGNRRGVGAYVCSSTNYLSPGRNVL